MPNESPSASGEPSPAQEEDKETSSPEGRTRARKEEPGTHEFVRLLEYLKANRGFDFSGYKLPSLIRRVQKRMQQFGIASYTDYIDYLEVHPDEFLPLFNTVLINVTGFFRDPQAWQMLNEQVLPRILEAKGPDDPVRCWSAGCASGEEAYTLAILLAEALGEKEFRRRVKIYATDVDEEALAQARQGSYSRSDVEDIPAELLERYFETVGERRVFRTDLRRSLIFGRHDLVQDAAISRLDLLICRNTLMYLNAETQAKVLARFHFALNRTGYLFLGKAETLLSHSTSFRPVDLKTRLFQRAPTSTLRDRMLALTPANSAAESQVNNRHVRIRDAAFDNGPVAQISLDRGGHLVMANERARRLFNLGSSDAGRLLQDLEISYRPVELRSHIEAACSSRVAVVLRDVAWHPAGAEPRILEIHILPLTDGAGALLGASVSFLDMTLQHQLHADLGRANQELETAYEELQSSNEELETTNEELQSTIEELETTNEELQSANEELETMNEELQSTNDELRATNDLLQGRSEEVDRLNLRLRSILSSLRAAVVVLNRRLEVEIWSHKAQELWGLRSEEVQGQPFLDLDIGLPVDQLREPLRSCLDSDPEGTELLLDGVNRRGRPVQCLVSCTRLGDGTSRAGVILLMEEVSGESGVRSDN
ncbi:MAG: two-component system, chemotaxis family, CheB/CheR fusion protein [Acidobacteriota bacterium]|jgi:two-component system CheB/CheR fusion protein|nr:two-component system, chemotaxis family, CheB/CheR fusion protein [Acidobacteriota bacterium]